MIHSCDARADCHLGMEMDKMRPYLQINKSINLKIGIKEEIFHWVQLEAKPFVLVGYCSGQLCSYSHIKPILLLLLLNFSLFST